VELGGVEGEPDLVDGPAVGGQHEQLPVDGPLAGGGGDLRVVDEQGGAAGGELGEEGVPRRGAELGLLEDVGERDRHGEIVVGEGRRILLDAEHARLPAEDVEQGLPDLDGEDLAEHARQHEADHGEDLAEPDPGLLLGAEGLGELLLVDVAEVDEQLPEELARIGGRGAHRAAVAQVDGLADGAPLAGEGARRGVPCQELDELRERHEREASGEAAHVRSLPGKTRGGKEPVVV
jgi:hypothetical protein